MVGEKYLLGRVCFCFFSSSDILGIRNYQFYLYDDSTCFQHWFELISLSICLLSSYPLAETTRGPCKWLVVNLSMLQFLAVVKEVSLAQSNSAAVVGEPFSLFQLWECYFYIFQSIPFLSQCLSEFHLILGFFIIFTSTKTNTSM